MNRQDNLFENQEPKTRNQEPVECLAKTFDSDEEHKYLRDCTLHDLSRVVEYYRGKARDHTRKADIMRTFILVVREELGRRGIMGDDVPVADILFREDFRRSA